MVYHALDDRERAAIEEAFARRGVYMLADKLQQRREYYAAMNQGILFALPLLMMTAFLRGRDPVYGRLWSTEQHANNVALATSDFANVAIEGEFAVTLHHDVDPGGASIHAIAAAVEQVFTVIELHNLVLHSDERGPELIANNAIHAGVVRSSGVRPPATAAATSLSVECDGRNVGQWSSRRWPDDVLQEVPWLVGELVREGLRLERGQTILTGAWGPPLPLTRREGGSVGRVEVVSTIFGSVAASFS